MSAYSGSIIFTIRKSLTVETILRRHFVATVITSVLAVVAIILVFSVIEQRNPIKDEWVVLTFLPSLGITMMFILLEAQRCPFSLHLVHLFTIFILLELAPLLQFISGAFLWSDLLPGFFGVSNIIIVNIMLLIWLGVYYIGYKIGGIMAFRGRYLQWFTRILYQPVSPIRVKFGLIFGFGALAYLAYRGYGGMITRGAYEGSFSEFNNTEFILVSVFVRAIPLMALAALLLLVLDVPRQRRVGTLFMLALLAAGVFWYDNPLAASRYWTGTMGIGFGVILFLRSRKTACMLIAMLILSIVLLQALDTGRHASEFSEVIDAVMEAPTRDAYLSSSGDLGAYADWILINAYVEDQGIRWGHQLLGVFLFWIPRVFWVEKPVGSGSLMARHWGLPTENIDATLPAEAMMNFGWLGIPLFAWSFGMVLGYLDIIYRMQQEQSLNGYLRLINVLYVFWLGMIAFITRGDLLSSFGYTASITVATMIATCILPGRSAKKF